MCLHPVLSKHAIEPLLCFERTSKLRVLQEFEARAVQCESDITFQRGQVRQSYIGMVCAQLQRHLATYMTAAVPAGGEPPEGVSPAAVDLVISLVQVQADLVSLAPTACITQVRPTRTQPSKCANQAEFELHTVIQYH